MAHLERSSQDSSGERGMPEFVTAFTQCYTRTVRDDNLLIWTIVLFSLTANTSTVLLLRRRNLADSSTRINESVMNGRKRISLSHHILFNTSFIIFIYVPLAMKLSMEGPSYRTDPSDGSLELGWSHVHTLELFPLANHCYTAIKISTILWGTFGALYHRLSSKNFSDSMKNQHKYSRTAKLEQIFNKKSLYQSEKILWLKQNAKTFGICLATHSILLSVLLLLNLNIHDSGEMNWKKANMEHEELNTSDVSWMVSIINAKEPNTENETHFTNILYPTATRWLFRIAFCLLVLVAVDSLAHFACNKIHVLKKASSFVKEEYHKIESRLLQFTYPEEQKTSRHLENDKRLSVQKNDGQNFIQMQNIKPHLQSQNNHSLLEKENNYSFLKKENNYSLPEEKNYSLLEKEISKSHSLIQEQNITCILPHVEITHGNKAHSDDQTVTEPSPTFTTLLTAVVLSYSVTQYWLGDSVLFENTCHNEVFLEENTTAKHLILQKMLYLIVVYLVVNVEWMNGIIWLKLKT